MSLFHCRLNSVAGARQNIHFPEIDIADQSNDNRSPNREDYNSLFGFLSILLNLFILFYFSDSQIGGKCVNLIKR